MGVLVLGGSIHPMGLGDERNRPLGTNWGLCECESDTYVDKTMCGCDSTVLIYILCTQ